MKEMLLNPLWTSDQAANVIRDLGFSEGIKSILTRRQGTTTGQAFEAIGKALQNPNCSVGILDHSNVGPGQQQLIDTISHICGTVGLEHISITKDFVCFGKPLKEI